jgi:hypothetical protein
MRLMSRCGRCGDLILQDFTQGGGVEPCVGEDASMAGAVRAERCIACAACIPGGMALRAGLIEGLIMQADPIGVDM